jgi:homoserine dehydrogenase
MHIRLFALGFGNVGRALAQMLADKAVELHDRYNLTLSFTGIATRSKGAVLFEPGAHAAELLTAAWQRGRTPSPPPLSHSDLLHVVREVPADVVLELTPLNPHSGQPAIDYIRAALASDRHVVTANKGPIAYAYHELRALAEQHGVALRFESTVLDGTPLFGMVEAALPATVISGFRGLLNSTTNYVLDSMSAGDSLETAVAAAQRAGIAEADPANDLEGWDAAVKATVLANVLMGVDLRPSAVERVGLGADAMRQAMVQAREQATRGPATRWTLKQVVEAHGDHGRVRAGVRLATLPPSDLFAHLGGMETAVQLQTDTMQELTLIEGAGGPGQTAFGVLADLITIARRFYGRPPAVPQR